MVAREVQRYAIDRIDAAMAGDEPSHVPAVARPSSGGIIEID
jgi:hypothetical protein